REPDWPVHREGVTYSGGDRLPATSFHSNPEGRDAVHGEPYGSFMHPQAPPGPLRNPVTVAQTGREGVGVERPGCPGKVEPFGQLSPVAERTVERRADLSRPLGLVQYPWPLLERRLMPDMLVVETRQLSHPVTSLVLMEPDDRSSHPLSLPDSRLADNEVVLHASLAVTGDVAVQDVRPGFEVHRGGVDI